MKERMQVMTKEATLGAGEMDPPSRARVKAVRPARYDWDGMRNLFVHGEDLEGRRSYPTTGDLAARFGAKPQTVSAKATCPDAEGKTWHDHREGFRAQVQRETDEKLAQKIAEAQVGFRALALDVAMLGLRHVAQELATRPPSPDGLIKLLSAAVKAQDLGQAAMVAQAKENNTAEQQAIEDWTLIRAVRSGEWR